MSWASEVHAGIVEDDITDVDEVAVEDEGAGRFGHVAAGLPPCPKAGGFELAVEPHDGNGDWLELASEGPWQVRERIVGRRWSIPVQQIHSSPPSLHAQSSCRLSYCKETGQPSYGK